MANYVKADLLHIFYKDNDSYTYFGYSQSDSLNIQQALTEVSSKDHGVHSDQTPGTQTWGMSGSLYYSPTSGKKLISMALAGKQIDFCFAQAAETNAEDGLKTVSGFGDQQSWTIGSVAYYGKGYITNMSLESSHGDVAQCSFDVTGVGSLTDTKPGGE